jgi:hypothetical protein
MRVHDALTLSPEEYGENPYDDPEADPIDMTGKSRARARIVTLKDQYQDIPPEHLLCESKQFVTWKAGNAFNARESFAE